MDFFTKGVDVLQKLVILIGAGLGVWGVVNLLEGYGNDNPGAKVTRDETVYEWGWYCFNRNVTCSFIKNLFS
jgi:hypothetical protein